MKQKKILIVGAGVSGLVAAQYLEKNGFKAEIFEKNNSVGGRLQTEENDGFLMDVGFQVFNTQYEMVQKYLNLEALEIKTYKAAAVLHSGIKQVAVGNFLKHPSFIWGTLFSSLISWKDRFLLVKFCSSVIKKSSSELFELKTNKRDTTTIDYLINYGFSDQIINNFFKPFFSGVYLDKSLEVSSRFFKYLMKLFIKGEIAVPNQGIQAIAKQLEGELKTSKIHFNLTVDKITRNALKLKELEEEIAFDACIVCTAPQPFFDNLKDDQVYLGCTTLYFEVDDWVLKKGVLHLQTDDTRLINSMVHPINQLDLSRKLLSVTVIHDGLVENDNNINIKVEKELKRLFPKRKFSHLKSYVIPKALPQISQITNEIDATETKLIDKVYLAGDAILQPSLQGAMRSGEIAAQAVIDLLNK